MANQRGADHSQPINMGTNLKLTNQRGADVSKGIKRGAGARFGHSFTMAYENFVSELSEWARQNPKLAKGIDETAPKSENALKKGDTPKKMSEKGPAETPKKAIAEKKMDAQKKEVIPNDEEKKPSEEDEEECHEAMEESDEEEDNDKIDFDVVPHVSITVWHNK
ncbi:MAG: hypothetical protein GY821_06520 [Gammaproteobacteria bacterium]|nr:hypothetical protein [Gammaproteobacteria bacterium]